MESLVVRKVEEVKEMVVEKVEEVKEQVKEMDVEEKVEELKKMAVEEVSTECAVCLPKFTWLNKKKATS